MSAHRIGPCVLAVALLLAVGCSGQKAFKNPFAHQPVADPVETAKTGKISADRQAAIQKLGNEAAGKTPEEQARIAAMLAELAGREPNPSLRVTIYKALAKYPGPDAERALELGLHDQQAHVRVACVKATAEMAAGSAERETLAKARLAKSLSDDASGDVRLEAVRQLGKFKGDEVKTALRTALDDRDPAIQRRAMESLASLTGQSYGNDVPAWRTYLDGGTPPPPKHTPIAEQVRGYINRF